MEIHRQGMTCEGGNSSVLDQDRIQWWAFANTEMNFWIP